MENDELVRTIVAKVLSTMGGGDEPEFPIETSARHVHLSREHLDALFGKGYELTPKQPLSQPGQFLAGERVRVIGPAGVFGSVAVLGPVRERTQVEVSASDARVLGIAPPVRMSGDLSGAATVLLSRGEAVAEAPESAIVAMRHIHMTPADALRFAVADGETVAVRVPGRRGSVLEGVRIRVTEQSALAMHMDFDEANACMCPGKTTGTIARRACPPGAAAAPEPSAPAGRTPARKPAVFPEPRRGGKTVVSAEMAEALVAAGGPVRLPRGSIVTPLARDVFGAAKARVEFADRAEKEDACLSAR